MGATFLPTTKPVERRMPRKAIGLVVGALAAFALVALVMDGAAESEGGHRFLAQKSFKKEASLEPIKAVGVKQLQKMSKKEAHNVIAKKLAAFKKSTHVAPVPTHNTVTLMEHEIEAASGPDASPSPFIYTGPDACFAKEASTACLAFGDATPAAAYAQCYEGAAEESAKLVLMKELTAGDRVLTITEGLLAITRVVVNQHAHADKSAPMLTLHTSQGAVSMTPDHAVFVDGALVAASEAKAGSVLTTAEGEVAVARVTKSEAGIINPVTATGTILASDASAPILAASHPIHIAPLMLESSVARSVANAALYFVGNSVETSSRTGFVALLLVKAAATLAVVGFLTRKVSTK